MMVDRSLLSDMYWGYLRVKKRGDGNVLVGGNNDLLPSEK